MTLFRNVNIVKENTVEKGEVLVRNGKIAEVATAIETTPETEIVPWNPAAESYGMNKIMNIIIYF